MISTVIFDLDDTLYDEIEYCKSGYSAVAASLAKLPQAPDAGKIFNILWQQFTTADRTRVFNATLEKLGINYDNNLIADLVKLYRGHNPNITLPSDSETTLETLDSRYTLALLTDGYLPAQKLKVQALGIKEYFKVIIYTEELGRQFWKPSPLGFERLLEKLNEKPQSCVYIADNAKKDFIAPNKLGIATIQLIRPSRIHPESPHSPQASPQHTIHGIDQLPNLLQNL